MSEALELRGLTKDFGDVRAVDGLDLRVQRGEMFALVGPDGAGKTTCIRLICGAMLPSSGEAFVEAGRLLSPWSGGRVESGAIAGIGGERSDAPALNAPEVTLFTVVFMVRGAGEATIALDAAELLGEDGQSVEYRVLPGRVEVRATEEER